MFRPDLPCTHLAHLELESVNVIPNFVETGTYRMLEQICALQAHCGVQGGGVHGAPDPRKHDLQPVYCPGVHVRQHSQGRLISTCSLIFV